MAPANLDFYTHREENEVNLVWKKKSEINRYQVGMNGAFLLVPFQCDICWFVNLQKREPDLLSLVDLRILGYIRRVNLDVIWSRAPGTVSNTKSGIVNIIQCWKELGLEIKLPKVGPWPVEDHVGFGVALAQLRYSQREGQNRATHLQFDSIRKLRTSYAHLHQVGRLASNPDGTTFKSLKGESMTITDSPTDSRFYQMFMRGLLLRMGRQVESNWGLDYRILVKIMINLEYEFKQPSTLPGRKREVVMLGSYLIICFVCALRGNEGFLVESDGLQQMIEMGNGEAEIEMGHVVIPLLGRFKNEDGEKWHVMVSANVTGSGLLVRQWIERLVEVLKAEDKGMGPAFCTMSGEMIDYWAMNNGFVKEVETIQKSEPNLIDQTIEVGDNYSIFRSLRKGSTARAIDMNVNETVIDLHNRWRNLERTGGQRSTRSMRAYYNDLRTAIRSRLTYSKAL